MSLKNKNLSKICVSNAGNLKTMFQSILNFAETAYKFKIMYKTKEWLTVKGPS